MGYNSTQDRRPVAVVVTTDGRRVQMPIENRPFGVSVSPLALLRSLLEELLGSITGSRRETGGSRSERR